MAKDNEMPNDVALGIVHKIVGNLLDRKGVGDELGAIDDEVMNDLMADLKNIVRKGVKNWLDQADKG